ncbi:MAG: transposase [Pseudomonadota bacterium]
MAHGSRLRIGRISSPGQVYSITTVTKNRAPVFIDFDAARTVISVLKEQQEAGHFDCLCYVLMPDHLHCLIQLGPAGLLSSSIQRVKSLTSKRLGGTVWQRGFHDRAIRRDEDVQAIARYIIANPLRAGLVASVKDYPHWDCIWL